ncbi:MAG: dihydrodipicolinate synthase family protein [Herpetosiphonaceae bacterium]|nr:dihydrodipicolinate synthase family protein [Herpetosiphonaceae bacterium]
MQQLAGLYPPIPTPFDEQGKLDLHWLEANLARWSAQPLDGVVMPGSNSEAAFLTAEERVAIWQVCADVLKGSGKRLIAGTGAETTAETIHFTTTAAELGATAALVLPPYFYKPSLTHEVLVEHYQAVAAASPIPLLVYNVPAFTGVDFALPTLLKLAEHTQIVGIKDSSSNIVKMAEVLAQRPDFQVFAGTGSALLPFLSIGAAGGIMALANVAAFPLRRLYDAFRERRMEDARKLQMAVVALNSALTTRFGVSGLKYAMDQTGFYGGPVRRPLLPLSAQARAEFDRILAEVHPLLAG